MSTVTAPPRSRMRFSSRPVRRQEQRINVGDTERLFSFLGGVALTLYGLSRRSLIGLGLAGAGGSLLYRGVTGYCGAYQALGINTAPAAGPATS